MARKLEHAIDVPDWLRRDAGSSSSAERRLRDRQIGASISSSNHSQRVMAWWNAIVQLETERSSDRIGRRAVQLGRYVFFALVGVGLVVGASVTGLALTYDGSYPINLLALLALTIGMPAAFLLVNVVLLIARLFGRGAPGAGLSLGYWAGAWLDRLLGASEPVFVWPASRRSAGSRFATWQVVAWSQWVGVSFFAGAIVATLSLVALTDLAFGWSTTLAVETESIVAAAQWLSLPWSAWFTDAVPSDELVRTTRYFRIEGSAALPTGAALGGWWQFYLMSLVVYGLTPRLVFAVVSQWRVRAATTRLMLDDPEVTALLDRMSPALSMQDDLESQQNAGWQTATAGTSNAVPNAAVAHTAAGRGAAAIVWNAAIDLAAVAEMGFAESNAVALDVATLPADETAALADLSAAVDSFWVFAKGYEPPIGDFVDFLCTVREAAGAGRSIRVVPVGVDGGLASADDVSVWRQALTQVNDPALYVDDAIFEERRD